VGGQPFALIFWARMVAGTVTSNADLSAWLTAFRNAMNTSGLLSNLSNTVSVTQFRAVNVVAPGVAFAAVNTTAVNGTGSGATLPANIAVVLSWGSSAHWRGGKPRTYLPGLGSAAADTNHSLLDSSKAAIQAQAAAFLTAVNGISAGGVTQTELGFLHWQTNDTWLSPPAWFAFSGVTIHDRLGSQRRRLGRWLP